MQTSDFLSRCVLGTAALGGTWGKVDSDELIKAILMALENGIKCIDTAPAYGDAEDYVSIALSRWNGPMPQLSTKVGRLKSYEADQGFYDYSDEGMERSVMNSLKTLNVPAIDILFLHDPLAIPGSEVERVLAQLMNFKKKGYAKKLGVGGNVHHIFEKYNFGSSFDVAMEFNRLDACCWEALDTSFPFYQLRGMEFYAASPLHMGLLGDKFEKYAASPPAWLEKGCVEKVRKVKAIADKYALPLRSLAHRFLLSLKRDFRIVIGASGSFQLRQTIADISQGPLPESIMEEIMNLKNSGV